MLSVWDFSLAHSPVINYDNQVKLDGTFLSLPVSYIKMSLYCFDYIVSNSSFCIFDSHLREHKAAPRLE